MPLRSPWIVLTLLCLASLSHADESAAPAPRVRIQTSMGSFVIQLNPSRAPLTVANFLQYVADGHYNGTLLHRVVESFIIQGGGYNAKYEEKPVHASVANESGNGLSNQRATVGLARVDDPHSGAAQFYINLGDNAVLDPRANRWGYAVFGVVTEGMDTLERISHVETGSAGPFPAEAPLKPILIETAEVLH